MKRGFLFAIITGVCLIAQGDPDIGFDDTPMLPNQPWHVHDYKRPHPKVVTPGQACGEAPSDAVVLFDGKDLAAFQPSQWVVRDGYMEVAGRGDLVSKEKFGDVQLHVEWMSPPKAEGKGQGRGNSGVLLMKRYEVQVLDSHNSMTYADGQAGAIYGQWPPLVNASRKAGEWQSYDIVFESPKFEGEKLVKPAYQTVFHNGVLLHNHKEVIGRMAYRRVGTYAAHEAEDALMLQNHGNPVRYRNIWLRKLRGYDEPEK